MRALAALAAAVVALAAAMVFAGCGTSASGTRSRTTVPASIELSSPAFAPGGPIPRLYTCDGRDVSPPLRWSHVPQGAEHLSLVMRDPDAPGGNFIHWQLEGISPTIDAIRAGRTPPGARAGRNGFGTAGYRGPCPPSGPAHHYVITLSATAGRALLASGTLVGTYVRR